MRLDGGKDHYYPAWCRSLQSDPFWENAAAMRYATIWNNEPDGAAQQSEYTPPIGVLVSAIPVGSFASHPAVGVLYQFLLQKSDGSFSVAESENLATEIDKVLSPRGLSTHDVTLYSPISII